MLRIVMAVSADGFVAKGPQDTMEWTGREDKRLFRELTMTRGGVMGAGMTTYLSMPQTLPGRRLVPLSRQGLLDHSMTLDEFALSFPTGWLIGGQTVALSGLSAGLVDRVHLLRNPAAIGGGQEDLITAWLLRNWPMYDRRERAEGIVEEIWSYGS